MMANALRRPVVGYGVTAAALFLALAPLRRAAADEAECKPMFDAMTRMFNTPSHQYLTQTSVIAGNTPVVSEIINTGKSIYVFVDGKWHDSAVTSAQLQQQEEESRRRARLTTCRLVRAEDADGTAATLFNAHTETEYGASDQQMWIGKASGLPVREIIEMDLGDHGGKTRAEIKVVYTGIEAPVVATR